MAQFPGLSPRCISLVLRIAVAFGCGAGLLVGGAPSASTAVPPDLFTGTVDEFYVVPDPLPAGAPGELIRIQLVSEDSSSTTLRIMYHSRDAGDRDRAVTGKVTYPNSSPPAGGWPVVSHANGTVGLASVCALSRNDGAVSAVGLAGIGVATDYVGLGPVGETHPYLSRPSEGLPVIDAVRAVRNIAEAGAGSRWLAIGGSQGGHGAIAANELADTYAPELDLVGAVSLAPGAMFDRSYGGIDDIVGRIVGVMMLYGAAAEHPEIDPNDYVGLQTAAAAAEVLPDQCIGDIINAFVVIPPEDFWTNEPRSTEPARSILLANDVGHVAADSPLLLVSGTADTTVVIERVRDLFDRLCDTGQVTEYTEYEGATHNDIGAHAATQVVPWVAARFAGGAPMSSCPEPPPPPPPPPDDSTGTTSTAAPPLDVLASTGSPADGVVAVAAAGADQAAGVTPRFTG